MNLIK